MNEQTDLVGLRAIYLTGIFFVDAAENCAFKVTSLFRHGTATAEVLPCSTDLKGSIMNPDVEEQRLFKVGIQPRKDPPKLAKSLGEVEGIMSFLLWGLLIVPPVQNPSNSNFDAKEIFLIIE